ncbi:Alternative cytochrome c oxidase subunit 2 [compost metagenome]|uniref:Cytochrome C oxidase subunit II n=1 Tax=Paenibacillus rhizolycopersici TaxID=2780073 RepID=A0ABS2H892_9BACL|nr:cytochrome C oxidase subunit II [Paenibacillus rhizolycopersici]MUG87354.1 cytochrome C oxidase subunit II [Paenibacillus timonensis]
MKKSIAIVASSVLLLLVTACSSGNATESGGSAAESNLKPEAELVIEASNYQFDQTEYHLKKDVPVKIVFKNASGNHGVLIPGLKVQLDRKNDSAVIVPTETGEFEMSCSVMCGSGHSGMISKIIVE